MEHLSFGKNEYIGIPAVKNSCIGCDFFGIDTSCEFDKHNYHDQRCETHNIIWKKSVLKEKSNNMKKYTILIFNIEQIFFPIKPIVKRIETNNLNKAIETIPNILYVFEGWPKQVK